MSTITITIARQAGRQAGKRPLKTRKDFIYHYNGIISEHEGK
jgi:hypothetical protein